MMEENINTVQIQTEEDQNKNKAVNIIVPAVLILLVVALGVWTGFQISRVKGAASELPSGQVSQKDIAKGKEYGMKDPGKTDNAVGVVEKGGINGEGTHKLLREGGPSQTVYVTSSVLDLDQFVGEKVQVWGETNRAQKAGWLMDVVKLKVLD